MPTLNSDDLWKSGGLGYDRMGSIAVRSLIGRPLNITTNVYIKTLIKSLWFKTFIKTEIKIIFQVYVEYKTKIN